MTKPTAMTAGSVPFSRRHIGPSHDEVRAMLEVVGAASLDELVEQTVPRDIRQREPLSLRPRITQGKR